MLQRVKMAVKKLGSQRQAFRGKNAQFGLNNNENFTCLELLAEFNPFLSNQISINKTRIVVKHPIYL